jgi:hypothetical protein
MVVNGLIGLCEIHLGSTELGAAGMIPKSGSTKAVAYCSAEAMPI